MLKTGRPRKDEPSYLHGKSPKEKDKARTKAYLSAKRRSPITAAQRLKKSKYQHARKLNFSTERLLEEKVKQDARNAETKIIKHMVSKQIQKKIVAFKKENQRLPNLREKKSLKEDLRKEIVALRKTSRAVQLQATHPGNYYSASTLCYSSGEKILAPFGKDLVPAEILKQRKGKFAEDHSYIVRRLGGPLQKQDDAFNHDSELQIQEDPDRDIAEITSSCIRRLVFDAGETVIANVPLADDLDCSLEQSLLESSTVPNAEGTQKLESVEGTIQFLIPSTPCREAQYTVQFHVDYTTKSLTVPVTDLWLQAEEEDNDSDNDQDFVPESESRPRKKNSHFSISKETLYKSMEKTGIGKVRKPNRLANGKLSPLLPINTTVLDIQTRSVWILRQITEIVESECTAESTGAATEEDIEAIKYMYYFRSPVKTPFQAMMQSEKEFLKDHSSGKKIVSAIATTTCSAVQSDIYMELTAEQRERELQGLPVPRTSRYPPDVPCQKNKKSVNNYKAGTIWENKESMSRALKASKKSFASALNESFRVKHTEFLTRLYELLTATQLDFDTNIHRFDWKNWNKNPSTHPQYKFETVHMLVHSVGTNDSTLESPIDEVTSIYSSPHSIARDPEGYYTYMTAKARPRPPHSPPGPLSKKHPRTTKHKHGGASCESAPRDDKQPGISKGFNYCNRKARQVIMIAKQLIVFQARFSTNTIEPKDLINKLKCYNKALKNNYDGSLDTMSLKPLPQDLLDKVDENQCLFPRTYVKEFFMELHGVGLKIRNLMAEFCYGKPVVSLVSSATGIKLWLY